MFDDQGQFLTQWGALGSGVGQFKEPAGLAVDGSGFFYVADYENDRIQKFRLPRPTVSETIAESQSETRPVEFVVEVTGGPNTPLSGPVDVAVDQEGNLFVVDGFNHRIQKFGPDGQFLTMWGGEGDGDGQLNLAFRLDTPGGAIALDGQGHIYVADPGNARIQKFDLDGNFLAKWGSYGVEDGQFLAPMGLAVDEADNVYVGDNKRHDIQMFDGEGQFLARWGSRGTEAGQIERPFQVTLDAAGHLYVADAESNRIDKFDRAGQFLHSWGTMGGEAGQFLQPYGLTLDGQGRIYVSDQFNHRVQIFDSEGDFLAQWGTLGSDPGQFKEPGGLAVDDEGYIHVADSGNNRVQKFRLLDIAIDGDSAVEGQP
jgi:DNA-binding beta-propeller fold protein YncE